MRRACRILGSLSLFLAGVGLLLAIASWPPGGLMFALPYFFLFLAIPLAVLGGLLLFLGRASAARSSPEQNATARSVDEDPHDFRHPESPRGEAVGSDG